MPYLVYLLDSPSAIEKFTTRRYALRAAKFALKKGQAVVIKPEEV